MHSFFAISCTIDWLFFKIQELSASRSYYPYISVQSFPPPERMDQQRLLSSLMDVRSILKEQGTAASVQNCCERMIKFLQQHKDNNSAPTADFYGNVNVRVIIVEGLDGVGKSTTASTIAMKLNGQCLQTPPPELQSIRHFFDGMRSTHHLCTACALCGNPHTLDSCILRQARMNLPDEDTITWETSCLQSKLLISLSVPAKISHSIS